MNKTIFIRVVAATLLLLTLAGVSGQAAAAATPTPETIFVANQSTPHPAATGGAVVIPAKTGGLDQGQFTLIILLLLGVLALKLGSAPGGQRALVRGRSEAKEKNR